MPIEIDQAQRALANGEFVPYFQPLVSLRTGQLAGFEILARWRDPKRGLVPPDEFITAAERDGWIGALTQELLQQAFASASVIPAPLTLAINISSMQLHDYNLPRQIERAAEESGFSMERVVIEITESALTHNLDRARSVVYELKAMGCGLALDDFGTGYSSLLHLQSLPFDELKVDRSFVSSMTQHRDSRKIVAAVVGLGLSMGMTTVAEGVETKEQAEMLLWMGSEQAQGYLYGKPVPAEELAGVVAALRQRTSRSLPNPWRKVSPIINPNALPGQRLAQLQAVYDGAPVGLGFLDRQMRYVSLNQRLADMNGFQVEEHLGKTAAEMLPELFHRFEPYLRRALEGEAISGVEITKPANDERDEQTLLVSYQPARDEAGEVVGVSLAVADVTALAFTDNALKESEDQHRQMMSKHPQTAWIMDPEGASLEVSPPWETTVQPVAEITRDPDWLAAVHPDDLVATMDSIAVSARSGLPIKVEYRARAADGSWRWMRSEGDPRFDAAGKIVCWSSSVEDINNSRQAKESLRKSNALIDAMPVGLVIADETDGVATVANPEAMKIFGDAVIPGLNVPEAAWSAAAADEKLMESADYPLQRALHGQTTDIHEVLVERNDGSEVWVQRSGAPIVGAEGEIAGAVVVIQDIDAMKRDRDHLNPSDEMLMEHLAAYEPEKTAEETADKKK